MPMRLAISTETYSAPENQSWLGSAHGVGTGDSITIDGDTFLATFPTGVVPSGVVLAKRVSDSKYIQYAGTPEKQRIAVDATGGTFTITLEGQTTIANAFNISTTTLTTNLETLSNVDIGDILVTGGPGASGGGTPYFLEFVAGDYVDSDNPPAVTTNAASLTGGAGTAVVTTTVASPTDGSQIAAGLLLTTVELGPKGVATPTSAQVGDTPAALYWHGEIIVASLPANSGWDSRAAADLGQIRTQ